MAFTEATISDFRGGLNTQNLPWELSPEGGASSPPPEQRPYLPYATAMYYGGSMQFPACNNLLLGKVGTLTLRGGQHEMIPSVALTPHGFFQFRNPATSRLMLAVGTGIEAWTINPSSNFDTSLVAPTNPCIATAGIAGLLSGDYQYYYTFVDSSGTESTLSPSASVTVLDQKVVLTTVQTSPQPTVIARNIYRTGGGSKLPMSYVGQIADNVSAGFTDNAADSDLSYAEQYSYMSPATFLADGGFIYNGVNHDAEVNFAAMYTNCFFTDGITTPQKWDGSLQRTYRMGIVPPTTAPVPTVAPVSGNSIYTMTSLDGKYNYGAIYKMALPSKHPVPASAPIVGAAGAGLLNTGTGPSYHWFVTYLFVDGTETLAGPTSAPLVLTLQEASLTAIPVGPSNVVARNIYRSGGNNTQYFLVTTLNDNTSTIYTDNTPDALIKVPTTYTPTVIYSFAGESDGRYPSGRLVLGSDGNYYGVTGFAGDLAPASVAGGGTFFQFNTVTDTLAVIYSFPDFVAMSAGELSGPCVTPCIGTDGAFYGMCFAGGTNDIGGIFQVSTDGTYKTLHNFDNASGEDVPSGELVQLADGLFYGCTGANSNSPSLDGNFFSISKYGSYTNLYSFSTNGLVNGSSPTGGLTLYGGVLYGQTRFGGIGYTVPGTGNGTTFKITTAGAITTLHSYAGGAGGINPYGGFLLADDNYLYCVTDGAMGGGNNGLLIANTPAGAQSVLHTFTDQPVSVPYQAADGLIYGYSRTTVYTVVPNAIWTFSDITSWVTGGANFTEPPSFSPGTSQMLSNSSLPGASGLTPYRYYVTFTNDQGTESNPSPVTQGVVSTYQDVNLVQIPTSSDAQVTGRNLYRVGGTSTAIQLVKSFNDNTTTAYTDTTRDIDLGLTVISFAHDVPPSGIKYLHYYNQRLWAFGDPANPYRLHFSSYQFGEYWPTIIEVASIDGGYFDISSTNQDNIVGLGQTGSSLLIFNTKTVWSLLGDSFEAGTGFVLNPIAGAKGCISRKSIAFGAGEYDECFYLGFDGQVYSVTGSGFGRISQDIEATLRAISTSDLANSYAVYIDLSYHLFIPLSAGGIIGLRYDTRTRTWANMTDTELLGQTASASTDTGIGGEMWFETASGYDFSGVPYNGIVSALSINDNTSSIPVQWLSPEFEYGSKNFVNAARRLRIEGTCTPADPAVPLRAVVNAITGNNRSLRVVTHTYKFNGNGSGVLIDTRLHTDLQGQRLQVGIQGAASALEVQSCTFWFSPDIREVTLT